MIKIGSCVRVLGRGISSRGIYYKDTNLKGTVVSIENDIARVEFGKEELLYDDFKISQLTECNDLRDRMINEITGDRFVDEWNKNEGIKMVDIYLSIFDKLNREEIEFLYKATDEYVNEHFTLMNIFLHGEIEE